MSNGRETLRPQAVLAALLHAVMNAIPDCGVVAHGVTGLRFSECTHEKLVAFLCKQRRFCPSCGGGAVRFDSARRTWLHRSRDRPAVAVTRDVHGMGAGAPGDDDADLLRAGRDRNHRVGRERTELRCTGVLRTSEVLGRQPRGAHLRFVPQAPLHVGLAQARAVQNLCMFGRENDERRARVPIVVAGRVGKGVGKDFQQVVRILRMAVHVERTRGGDDRHGTRAGGASALDMEGFPRILVLVLGAAETVLAGLALCRPIHDARDTAAQILQ
ncbi:MAG: hypothetical protein EHM59_10070 [Betaproteobacteria bacterium]|nr:MAG: hypothetical protein EHM59_10070 [Betaproteobacteria bacterium]